MAEINQSPSESSMAVTGSVARARAQAQRCGWLALACLWVGLGGMARAADAGRVVFPHSVKAVAGLASPTVKHQARVKRTSLAAGETAATMPFEISLVMRNFSELQSRIQQGEIISPAEMEARYFPTAADYQQVVQWVSGQALTVTRTDANH